MLQTMEPPSDIWSLLERTASAQPEQRAIVDGDVHYAALLDCASRLAESLRARGVERGIRVAILEHNTPAFLTWTFAAAGAGAILVPLNPHLSAPELHAILADAEPRLIVSNGSYRDLVEAASQGLEDEPGLVFMGAAIDESGPAFDAASEHAPFGLPLAPAAVSTPEPSTELGRVPAGDVAQLYYTSGTTGQPKGVPLTHGNIVSHALAATTELDLAQDDVWGHIAPMYHLADAWASIAITAVGGSHAFLPRFEAQAALRLIDGARITVTNLVPTMVRRMLLELPEYSAGAERPFSGGSLRLLLSGGAPIAPSTVEAILREFRCEYVQTYGLTETSPYLTLAILEPRHRGESEQRQLARRARTGRPFETVELEVVDENGAPVARDDTAVGEIVARGPSVTPGYWRRPEETARAFRGGWFHTGDLATIDREGWLNIVDRRKDMILSGGENIYSIEVENALYSHPSVAECAAFGLPSEAWGEEVTAAVVARARVREDELRQHCRGQLAHFKVPKRVVFLDALPKTGTGKIEKRTLRAQYGAALP